MPDKSREICFTTEEFVSALILRQSGQLTVVHISEKTGKANSKKKAAGRA
jgi:hypothetical protein